MKILALAYHFPPDSGSGTFRSLFFFNHLADLGEDLVVITAKVEDFATGSTKDSELNSIVDHRIDIARASVMRPMDRLVRIKNLMSNAVGHRKTSHAEKTSHRPSSGRETAWLQGVKDTISDLLTWPDEHVGWIPDAVRKGSRIISAESIDCIYATGGPWSALVAATLLKKKYRLPLVLDFRDPWTSNPNIEHRRALFKSSSCKLEAFCLRNADFIIANTEEVRQDFVRRYPHLPARKFVTITNGFEHILQEHEMTSNRRFTLVHAGELYQSRNPANFFKAILYLLQEGKFSSSEILVQLIGSSSLDQDVQSLLCMELMRDVVEIIPRVPHSAAIQYQLAADILVVFQTGFPLQIPRKFYEYMSLLKPVLAITEIRGATARMVKESNVGIIAEPSVESIKEAIAKLYESWKSGAEVTVSRNDIARYQNDYLALCLQAVLQNACGETRGESAARG